MRNLRSLLLVACAVLSIVRATRANAGADQDRGAERVIHHPKAEVEKVIQQLHPTFDGRLPILDGFATEPDESWDHFTRGYYECAVQAVANGQNETLVRVTAKITAWYTDSNPSQSGYRVLLSNGRVETDLLDRIEEALGAKGPGSASPQSQQSITSTPGTSLYSSVIGPPARLRMGAGSSPVTGAAGMAGSERNSISPGAAESPAASVIAPLNNSDDIESLKRKREEAEKKLSDLTSIVQNLDQILHTQAHPTDIAVVRKSGTRVMSKASASSPVLFTAESEDEFQVLDGGPDWIHVQISGASRGWIRRSDLNLPETLSGNTSKAGAAAATNEPAFRVVREDTNVFKGSWEQLNGKTVKIIWTAPSPAQVKPPSAAAKRNFFKERLVAAYQDISSHDQTVAGVVIVFDSADGGQIASTFENLKRWQTGALSEAAFWQLCSVDPPELLLP
jgi:hypothetical protein